MLSNRDTNVPGLELSLDSRPSSCSEITPSTSQSLPNLCNSPNSPLSSSNGEDLDITLYSTRSQSPISETNEKFVGKQHELSDKSPEIFSKRSDRRASVSEKFSDLALNAAENSNSLLSLPSHQRQSLLNARAMSRFLGVDCSRLTPKEISNRLLRMGLDEGCCETLAFAYEWSGFKTEDLIKALIGRGVSQKDCSRVLYVVLANQEQTYREIESATLTPEDADCLMFAINWAIFRSRANMERELRHMGLSEKDADELFTFIQYARTDLVQIQRTFASQNKGPLGQRLIVVRENPRLYFDYLCRKGVPPTEALKLFFAFRMSIYSHERIVKELMKLGLNSDLADCIAFVMRWLRETDESSPQRGLKPLMDLGMEEQLAKNLLFLSYYQSFSDPEVVLEEVFLDSGLTPPSTIPEIPHHKKKSRRWGMARKSDIAFLHPRNKKRGCCEASCSVM